MQSPKEKSYDNGSIKIAKKFEEPNILKKDFKISELFFRKIFKKVLKLKTRGLSMPKKSLKRKAMKKQEKTEKIKISVFYVIVLLYICYFVNLHFFYDWDTMDLAIKLKTGLPIVDSLNFAHPLVPVFAKTLSWIVEPLLVFKILAFTFAFILASGIFKVAYTQSEDVLFSLLSVFVVLFNFGLTFLITSLEDNLYMYGFIVFFIYFLFRNKFELSALFLAIAILVHIEAAIFIIMFIFYLYMHFRERSKELNLKFTLTAFVRPLFFLLVPLLLVYSSIAIIKKLSFAELVKSLTVSDYYSNPDWWYFASNRALIEQLVLAYYGVTSTFVCRYPEFLHVMPQAIYFTPVFLILVGVLLRHLKFLLKDKRILSAVPVVFLLIVHSMFYESYNIERWDFLPFFIVYFGIVGYSKFKNSDEKRKASQVRNTVGMLALLSFIFTLASFQLISGYTSNPIYDYADKLSEITTDQDIVIESIRETSELGLYIKYKLDDKVVFLSGNQITIPQKGNIYSSYYTYYVLSKNLNITGEIIWINKKNQAFSIVKVYLS